MKFHVSLIFFILVFTQAHSQVMDLAVIHHPNEEEITFVLFENQGDYLSKITDAYKARSYEVKDNYPGLNLSGDFDGDGLDEIAWFSNLYYTPNMNPAFTCSLIKVFKSMGDRIRPVDTWFSILDTLINFEFVDFSCASDFNADGLCDIALFYNDPSSDEQLIYVLESTGTDFTEPLPYCSVDRNEFNFTALKFVCVGDFNGNSHPDIAVFYNYFGEGPDIKQSIFLFESNGTSFSLLPGAAYNGIKEGYDFTEMKFALTGDYNQDGISDIAVLMKEASGEDLIIPVFEGSPENQMAPVTYSRISASDMQLPHICQAQSGDFMGESGDDLVLFFDDTVTGGQEIRVLENEMAAFNPPLKFHVSSPAMMQFKNTSGVFAGNFVYQALVTATPWKNKRKGAISFTFDDGYQGAFEHGAAELEAAGFKGTFYIFTDTAEVYDGILASTSLVKEYSSLGHEIGSHTRNHSNLGLLTETGNLDSLTLVLSSSPALLNERFNQQTVSLSIPFGSFRYETLQYISEYFHSARSSQYGYNLATPMDFFALRSWPILSTTTPEFVEQLVDRTEAYGYYLPLMYHDMTDKAFDEEIQIYNYNRELFRETLQLISEKDVWVDTHEHIYKYIRQRNALRIDQLHLEDAEANPGQFSFVASCDLPDSIFDMELTLQVRLPDSWVADSVGIESGDSFFNSEVLRDSKGDYILLNSHPGKGTNIQVSESYISVTGTGDHFPGTEKLKLTAYPNPFNSEMQINIDGQLKSGMQLLLLDMHGRQVRDIALQGRNSISLLRENLAPGLYMLLLFDAGIPAASLKLMAQ